jgi:hypothetical protein
VAKGEKKKLEHFLYSEGVIEKVEYYIKFSALLSFVKKAFK